MEDEPKVVKTIEGLAPVADLDAPAFANDCSVVWHPSGKHFYIATATHDIIAVSSESWSKSAKFSDEDLSGVRALTCTEGQNLIDLTGSNGLGRLTEWHVPCISL